MKDGEVSLKDSYSVDFWKARWEKEKESYISGPLYLYKGGLRGLKNLIDRNNLDFQGKIVLEASCGKCFYASFYRKKEAEVDCTDISGWVVENARSKGFNYGVWNLCEKGNFPFPGKKYNYVHCTQTLVHLLTDEHFRTGCENLVDKVEVGGYLIVGDRFLPDKKIDKPHIRYRTVGDYILTMVGVSSTFAKCRSHEGAWIETTLRFIDCVPTFPLGGRILLFRQTLVRE